MITYDATLPDGVHEINGSRSESYSDTEFSGHIEFTCPWNARSYYIAEIKHRVYPYPVFLNGVGSEFYQTYYPPVPISVSVSTMGAEGVNVEPVDYLTYQPYTMAHLTVEYKGMSRPGNFSASESVSPNFGMRQLPSWGYYWRSDGSPLLDNESPGIQETKCEITRTLTGIRRIPWWFYRLGGKVNLNAWVDGMTGQAYLPDTLLFVPSNMQRNVTYQSGDDDNIWTISFALKWNPIGWNSFRRPHGVDQIMRNGVPQYFYPRYYFPTFLIDLNEQVAGDPYQVKVPYIDGTVAYIVINFDGTVAGIYDTPQG